MGNLLPWLIVGWIFLDGRPRASAPAARDGAPAAPPRTVPLVAYIYRLPIDSYEVVRMATAMQPDNAMGPQRPREMGIFSNEAAALKLVKEKGWALAWTGVRELQDRP